MFFHSDFCENPLDLCHNLYYGLFFGIKITYIKIMILGAFCQKNVHYDISIMCKTGTKSINFQLEGIER